MEALRDSRSEWLVKKMPNGLDSKVGRLFEGGHDLSGGEWQRLALARIMYRDADIWILDEPTSSLDPEAEAGDLRRAERQPAGPDRHRDFAPILDRAHRRSHRRDRRRPRRRARDARRAAAARRPLRAALRVAGGGISVMGSDRGQTWVDLRPVRPEVDRSVRPQ